MLYDKSLADDWGKAIKETLGGLPGLAVKALVREVGGELNRIRKLDETMDILVAEIMGNGYRYKVIVTGDGRKEILNPGKREVIGWFLEIAPQARGVINAYLSGHRLKDVRVAYQDFGSYVDLTFVERDRAWRVYLGKEGTAEIEISGENWDSKAWLDTGVYVW